MAREAFYQQVKNALIKDGWKITDDPLTISISEAIKVHIDLADDNVIAAERDSDKIAVEIKSFISGSDISEFHTTLGQYLNYRLALEINEIEKIVYLAIPNETYKDFFQLPFIQGIVHNHQVKLIVYDPKREEIKQWIS